MSNVTGIIGATIHIGNAVLNDYYLTVTEITDGYRLTIQRGTEEQVIDVFSLSEEEIASIREAEQGRVNAEALRVIAENARQAAEAERVAAEQSRETDTRAAIAAAEAATEYAEEVSDRISEIDMTVEMLEPTAEPTAQVVQTEHKTTFELGIPKSNIAYGTFEVNNNMELLLHSPEKFPDIDFSLNENGMLEVTI